MISDYRFKNRLHNSEVLLNHLRHSLGQQSAYSFMDILLSVSVIVFNSLTLDMYILKINLTYTCLPQVLDEADRMLDMGFEPEVRAILSQTSSGLFSSLSSSLCLSGLMCGGGFFFFVSVNCLLLYCTFCGSSMGTVFAFYNSCKLYE
jgi:hypothetical protein